MRMSKLFSQTLREVPAEAETAGHQLLLRAGFIRQHAAGVFSYLPLARRVMDKIEAILRQEMNAIGGQEVTMPIVNPAELWKESNRWFEIGSELGRFKDKNGRDMVLAMTHEEAFSDLVRREVRSYRQLPLMVYHIQTKWRDDPRPRAGLIRGREFTMKDSYTLDADWEGLDRQYEAHTRAYFRIFERCGLPVIAVKADVGMMGGKEADEFMYLTPIGEDTLLICDQCGYAANRQIAVFRKPQSEAEAALPVEKVATPGAKTIEDLAAFLGIPQAKTAKAVFMVARITEGQENTERFIFAIVRGDMDVNETKLANAVNARDLRPAREDEIRLVGAEPGYASPVGLRRGAGVPLHPLVVVDDLIPASSNLVAGANEPGYHLRNVNYGRDFSADLVADIVAAGEGSACARCGNALRTVRGVEVANIFKLGTHFSESLGCTFVDQAGEQKPLVMGSYGIGVTRLMACLAEHYRDEQGLMWPESVAPYQVHLVTLVGKSRPGVRAPGSQESGKDTMEISERLYRQLWAAGIETLWDDREESPGVKFNDADLIGLPVRLTVSERALKAGGVEFKRRNCPEKSILLLDQVLVRLKDGPAI